MTVLNVKALTKDAFKDLKQGDKLYTASIEKSVDTDGYKANAAEYTFKRFADAPVMPKEPDEKTSASMEKYSKSLKAFENFSKAFKEGLFAEVYTSENSESSVIVVNLLVGVYFTEKEAFAHMEEELTKMLDSLKEVMNG